MKKRKVIYVLSFCMMLFFSINASNENTIYDKEISSGDEYIIALRWHKAYEGQTPENINTGLKWVFSFLGARIEKGSFDKAVLWNNNIITADISKLGFPEHALKSFAKLFSILKQTGEYQQCGGIDIGRFVMLSLNSSYHYYAITGAEKTIPAVRSQCRFDTTKAAIIESSISRVDRLIDIYTDSNASRDIFIASEGHGSLLKGTFEPEEFEVLDIMDNGQLRFAIYDRNGELTPVSDTMVTFAGKPAKCLWCHEINIAVPFNGETIVPGYYSPAIFKEIMGKTRSSLDMYRSRLNSDIDFNKRQEHTMSELLYISFMEPSAERLAIEWAISVDSVKLKLKNFPTHVHHEFPFLGTLYDRKDIDSFSPYSYVRVPESAREYSPYEPDLIN